MLGGRGQASPLHVGRARASLAPTCWEGEGKPRPYMLGGRGQASPLHVGRARASLAPTCWGGEACPRPLWHPLPVPLTILLKALILLRRAGCGFSAGRRIRRARAVDHVRQFLACAFEDIVQAIELRLVAEGHAPGNREEAGNLHCLAPQRLHFRRPPAAAKFPRPGWPAELLILFPLPLAQERAPGIGDGVHLLALAFGNRHEAAILQQLKRGIDRACAGRVEAAGTVLQRLHHLVAVHWPLLKQLQQDIFEVAAPEDAPGLTRTGKTRTEGTTRAEEVPPELPEEHARMRSVPFLLHPGRRPAFPISAVVLESIASTKWWHINASFLYWLSDIIRYIVIDTINDISVSCQVPLT